MYLVHVHYSYLVIMLPTPTAGVCPVEEPVLVMVNKKNKKRIFLTSHIVALELLRGEIGLSLYNKLNVLL